MWFDKLFQKGRIGKKLHFYDYRLQEKNSSKKKEV